MNHIAKEIMGMNLLTTHQRLYKLRQSYSDKDILDSLDYCSNGIRMSLESLIKKEYCGARDVIERVEVVDKDIIEEMRGE